MTYTVRPGDTCRSISIRVLGNARFADTLFRVNRARIASGSPDQLVAGTQLLIPDQMIAAAKASSGPAADPNEVTVEVNGLRYSGWESVTISRSLEAAAAGFAITLLDRWQQASEPWPIFDGDEVAIYIGSDLVLSGYVDAIGADLDAGGHSLSISGRDRTCDLIDCSIDLRPGVIKGKKLEEIGRQIVEPFGIEVRAEVDTGAPIAVFAVLPGETPIEALTRAAAAKNLVVTSDAGGSLVFTRSGERRAVDRIVEGQNLLAGSSSQRSTDRFSHYIVEGQGDGQGQNALREVYRDRGVSRYRPRIIHADGKATRGHLASRAQWEARVAAAASSQASITLQGWRQSDGTLWSANRIVSVEAPSLQVSGDLLIIEVTFEVGSSGTLTGLRLTRSDAYSSAEQLEANKDAVKQARVVKANG